MWDLTGGATFTKVSSRSTTDVLVKGDSTYIGDNASECGSSFACTKQVSGADYPHLGTLDLWFEDPPIELVRNMDVVKVWTTNPADIGNMRHAYAYMPGVLAHEFGHTAGLGHSVGSNDVMGYPDNKSALSDNDKRAMRATYQHLHSH